MAKAFYGILAAAMSIGVAINGEYDVTTGRVMQPFNWL
jgi:hypothetical protein